MKLNEVKKNIEFKLKIAGEKTLPSDEALASVLYEALVFVATKTIPIELTCKAFTQTKSEILRVLRDGNLVLMPEYPNFKNDKVHLQIDEDLNYAVINYACSLISFAPQNVQRFYSLAQQNINLHQANAIKIGQ